MYFKDKDGRMWLQTDNGFQNIGVSVKEEIVTFKKIASVEIIPSPVVVPSIEGAVPMTLRQAVSKLGNALGITRQTFNRWCVGEERGKTHREYIQRVRNIMEEMMEGYMLNGKINPVSGIFLMKNNFGYTDKSEVVLTPNSPFGENTASPEELQQKYLIDTAGDYGDLDSEES